MNRDVRTLLESGSELLKPLLVRHGFAYRTLAAGNSSGGQFAGAEFRRQSRRLEYHFRYSLGMVRYHLDAHSMAHQEYMRSVIGRPNAGHYPGFSSDPIDAFRDLLLDLEEYCIDFLEGSDQILLRRIENALAKPYVKPGLPE
jgi:hypothetical protein